MRTLRSKLAGTTLILAYIFTSCVPLEDPGALIEEQRTYEVDDFTRLEMGSAFVIDVSVGEAKSVTVRGDARNLDDLIVAVNQGTLKITFDDYGNRRHRTYVTITMPEVEAINFSGASTSTVSGISSDRLDVVVSGASKATLIGLGDFLTADISGASRLYAFDYIAGDVRANVSGASKARVYALERLDAIASGASYIGYKGQPIVYSNTSGASIVKQE